MALSITLIFGSCKKKEEPNEGAMVGDIRINGTTYQNNDEVHFFAGDSLHIEIDITDDYGLKSAEFAYQIQNALGLKDTSFQTVDVSDLSATAKYDFMIPKDMASNETIYLLFNITDTDNELTGFTITCKINPDSLPYPVHTSNAIIFNSAGTGMSAWDLDNDVAVMFDIDNPPTSSSDFNYLYQFNEYNAPGGFDATLLSFNIHNLKKITTSFDFDNASEATAKAAYDAAPFLTPANLVAGDIIIERYYYKDKYVVIKITDVVVTSSDNSDYIKFSYKKDL